MGNTSGTDPLARDDSADELAAERDRISALMYGLPYAICPPLIRQAVDRAIADAGPADG